MGWFQNRRFPVVDAMIKQYRDWGERGLIALPAVWLGVFFVLPLLIILRMSLSDPASAQPPYRPLWDGSVGGLRSFFASLDLENFTTVLTDSLYLESFLTSLRIAALGTVLTLLVGYPMALAIARASQGLKPLLLALIILPFWTSFLIRVYAWIAILKQEGLLNQVLMAIGLIVTPLEILNTEIAVQIGIAYSYLPFIVLPIYAALDRHDPSLLEAADDLGCPPWKAFWLITLPLSLPGIIGGMVLVFIPVTGEFIIPDLLGGSDTLMIGKLVWTEFFANRDWPMASTMAMALLIIVALPIVIGQRRQLQGLK
jgi:putrescine transport system permease protein